MALQVVNSFEEELKRRMQLAKKQGWSSQEIQKSVAIERSINRALSQRTQQVQSIPQPQQNKPSGLKRFLVNAGALVGSAGAGVAGAALAPVTGGASLVGAFGAGAGIEALRRRLLGEKQSIGASALEGGLAILPGAAKGIKAISGARKAAKVAEEVVGAGKVTRGASAEKQALKEALLRGFKTEESGRLTRAGESIRANQRGIRPGEKLINSVKEKPLNAAQSKEINQAINQSNKGLIPRSVRGQLINVQAEKEAAGKALTGAAKASKATITKEAKTIAEDTVSRGRSKILKFDPKNATHTKINNQYAERLSNAKTPEQLLEQRRVFDKTANAKYTNPTVEQSVDKELAAVYREATDKALAKIAPELKPLDKKFSLLSKAEQGMTNRSSKLNPTGFKPAGTSLNGSGVGGVALQATKEGFGKSLQTAGKITSSPVVKAGFRQGIARGLTKPYLEQPIQGQLPTDTNRVFSQPQNLEEDKLNQLISSGVTDPQALFDSLSTPDQDISQAIPTQSSPLGISSAELLQQSYEATLAGDDKRADDLRMLATAVASQEGDGGEGGLNVTKPTSEKYAIADAGMKSLEGLEQLLQSDPSILNKTRTPGRGVNVLGIGSTIRNATGTGEFDSLAFNAVDNFLRIKTGAAAPESEIRRYMNQIIPQGGDNEATVQQKLSALRQMFGSILSLAQQPNSTSFEDISQMFNQQQPQYY